MDALTFSNWGQVALYAAGVLTLLIYALKHLITMMTSSYGQIIASLQANNVALNTTNIGQQAQLTQLTAALTRSDKDCDEKIATLKRELMKDAATASVGQQRNTDDIAALTESMEAIRKNGGNK